MRIVLITSVLLATLSSCTFGVSPETQTPVTPPPAATGSANNTDVATGSSDMVGSGKLVTLNYTLRDGSATGPILETTLESVAMQSNTYNSGAQYQPFQVMIGSNGVIPGFEQGLLGMKKGEKKTIEVPAELGYGTTPRISDVPQYQIAPVFTMVQDKSLFGDVITQTVQKAELNEEMKNAVVGQVFTGANNATAKVTKVDETSVTLDIQNTDNPFYQKKLSVGLVAESADGAASFKITKMEGTGVTLEVTNKQSPFYNKNFAVGETLETAQGKVTIQEIKADSVTIAESHPLMGKTLFFEVDVVDIQ